MKTNDIKYLNDVSRNMTVEIFSEDSEFQNNLRQFLKGFSRMSLLKQTWFTFFGFQNYRKLFVR